MQRTPYVYVFACSRRYCYGYGLARAYFYGYGYGGEVGYDGLHPKLH